MEVRLWSWAVLLVTFESGSGRKDVRGQRKHQRKKKPLCLDWVRWVKRDLLSLPQPSEPLPASGWNKGKSQKDGNNSERTQTRSRVTWARKAALGCDAGVYLSEHG